MKDFSDEAVREKQQKIIEAFKPVMTDDWFDSLVARLKKVGDFVTHEDHGMRVGTARSTYPTFWYKGCGVGIYGACIDWADTMHFHGRPDPFVHIAMIVVPEQWQGRGWAEDALTALINAADELGYPLVAEPVAIKPDNCNIAIGSLKERPNKKELIKWYEKHGFEQQSHFYWLRTPQ